MSVMRAQFQRLLFPGLNELMFNAYREKEPKFRSLFKVQGSDSAFEEFRSVAGVGLFVRTPEGTPISQDRFYDGFPKRYDHVDYSQSIGFTHQAMRDFKVNIAGDRSSDLGRSARATQEILTHSILNLAFDAGTLGPDSKPLCATNHPNIRGGGQSNVMQPAAQLNLTSYRQALTMFRKFKDSTGVRRVSLTPKYLVVPPALEWEAKEIIESSDRPDTPNRATNVVSGTTTVFVDEYLTDEDNWFLMSGSEEHRMRVFERETFNTGEFEDEKMRIMWMFGSFALSYGWDNWLGIIGSDPV